MAVKNVGEIYICSVCGNEVIVTKVGGGTLVCCGKDMIHAKDEDIEEHDPEEEDESE